MGETEYDIVKAVMNLTIDSISKNLDKTNKEKSCIKIQSWYRGIRQRNHLLPLIIYRIKKFLKSQNIKLCKNSKDGRNNSCDDEEIIINLLKDEFKNLIKVPGPRMWYDILVYDKRYKWLPVNIKTTTTKTSDNTGNLAMCVYAFTDHDLGLDNLIHYSNGNMSKILVEKLKKEEYNKISKKDYYFLVVNKNDTKDIIVNSAKGLTDLTPNLNNLPFQVCWARNREFRYKNIKDSVKMLLECFQKPKPGWREKFMEEIRKL